MDTLLKLASTFWGSDQQLSIQVRQSVSRQILLRACEPYGGTEGYSSAIMAGQCQASGQARRKTAGVATLVLYGIFGLDTQEM